MTPELEAKVNEIKAKSYEYIKSMMHDKQLLVSRNTLGRHFNSVQNDIERLVRKHEKHNEFVLTTSGEGHLVLSYRCIALKISDEDLSGFLDNPSEVLVKEMVDCLNKYFVPKE